jgi:hypothetical protein
MKPVVRVLLSAATLAAGAVPAARANAQESSSARAAGMAGAYQAIATGSEAVRWNPANLGLAGRPSWSLSLPRLNLAGTVLGPGVFDVKDILDKGNDLTDQDRQAFLGDVPAAGFELSGGASIPWISLSMGPFAAEASTTVIAGGSVGKELIDLMLYARQYGDVDHERLADYRVGNTVLRDAAFSTIALSYGHSLIELPFPVSVGVTARYVKGHDLQRGRIFEPQVDLVAQELSLSALSIRSTGGTGYGVDVGVSARPLPALTVGLSVQNLVQKMDWDENLELRGDVFSSTEIADMSVEDMYDRLESRPFDANAAPLQAYALANDIYEQTYFPRIIRLGAALQHGATTLGATYSTTAGEGELTTGWPTYLAVGVEQKVPFLSFIILRGGLATSLDGATALSGGTTLQFGPVGISAAITSLSGNAEPSTPGSFDSSRFADRLAAGDGVGFSFGVDLTSF